MYRLSAVCFPFFLLFALTLNAQHSDDIRTLLKAGINDLSGYVNNYVEPAAKGLTYSFGSGWIQSAETHNALGFDIKVSVSAALIPSSDKFFLFREQDYNNIQVQGAANDAQVPSVFGPSGSSTILEIMDNQQQVIASLEAPAGADLPINFVPAPMIQAGFGLPKGTDIKLRVIPKMNVDDGTISMFGLGAQHDIKQYIPVIRELPFHLSGLVAFNSFNTSYSIDEAENQHANLRINTWTAQALVSKKLAILTVYGALGYNSGSTNFRLLGNYAYEIEDQSLGISDPVSLRYSIAGPVASLGARFKFGPVFINGDYTFQEYDIITVGLGVSIN